MKWYETINEAGIEEIAKKIGMKSQPKSTFQCPSCQALTRGSNDKRGAVGATGNRKGWLCHRCGATGSLLDFVSFHLCGSKYRELNSSDRRQVYEWAIKAGYEDNNDRKPKHEIKDTLSALGRKKETVSSVSSAQGGGGVFSWGEDKPIRFKESLWNKEGEAVRDYLLRDRKLSEDVIKDADLGVMKAQGMDWIVIPLKNSNGEIVNMRFRSLPPAGEKKSYRVCPSRPMPLYGSDKLATTFDDMVILCEGELDVLAMKTLGYDANVVSTTTGASSFSEDWLDDLEPFRSFWLFYDNDEAGNEGAKKVADKLGKYRCMRVKLNHHNDVGEALQKGAEPHIVDEAFNNAKSYVDSELKTVSDYADQLEKLINQPDTMRGRSTGSMRLDACCGGVKAGLWVITGDTGQGKTSWATWMCWEMARLGTPILLTSFEQSPIGTVQKLLRNQLGGDFTKYSADERRQSIMELDDLPIRILDHYGNADIDTVIESVRYSARRHGTKIAMIDHLHFLIKPSGDERNEIETAVRKLATLAVQDQITVFLICHPNNMAAAQQRRVKITDLKGASAIRQDAHVALVVERGVPSPKRGYPHSVIYFDKVRSEFGQAGSKCVLAYDPISCVYADRWEDTPAGRQGVKIISAPES